MVEDSPIPYEIGYIYFVLDFANNYCILSLVGSEQKQNPLSNYEYYPLDAYNFENKSFLEIKDEYLAKSTVKELVDQALTRQDFKKIFKNKTLFICQRHQKCEYKFEV